MSVVDISNRPHIPILKWDLMLRPGHVSRYAALLQTGCISRPCTKLASSSPPVCYFHSNRPWNAEIVPLRKQLKDSDKVSRHQKQSGSPDNGLSDEILARWQLTVGIEIHAQLNTARKLFSRSTTNTDSDTNTQIAAFDISVPGSLPLFQPESLIPALRAALALNCTIQNTSRFDRKHYFYHDQPAGYQITQYYSPLARDGHITLLYGDGLPPSKMPSHEQLVVGIKQIQLEQDTAKTQELEDGTNLIDFRRSGQPLIEIISLPHIHTPEAAAAYMRKIQGILYSVDAVTTGMELGGLRADVNVSVRRVGDQSVGHSYGEVKNLGQRTEIKNLSSFKAVEDAVRAERSRQIKILEAGGVIEGETRGWSVTAPYETRRLRGKEGEVDYRYLPDPDIPPLLIAQDLVDALRENLAAVPDEQIIMLIERYGLSKEDAKSLIGLDDGQRLDYFQEVVELLTADPLQYPAFGKLAGNWVLHELGALLTIHNELWSADRVPSFSLAAIAKLVNDKRITNPSAKRLLRTVYETGNHEVEQIVEDEGLWFRPLSDAEYSILATKVVEQHPDVVRDITEKGKQGKVQFLIGQMMRVGERNRMEASRAEVILRSTLDI